MSQRADLDAIIHLGDYIYEYGSGQYGDFRGCSPPHEILSLEDYRTRYKQYRSDPGLQEAHRQHPWISVWDDHEFCDDPFPGGADNHQPSTEGEWQQRVNTAIKVYDEWLPTRSGDPAIIYRSLLFGDLAAVHVLDIKRPLVAPVPGETQTMLGETQAVWLDEKISNTSAKWMILAQQQTFATQTKANGSGSSKWDKFMSSRTRIRDVSNAAGIENVIVLTGDVHHARASDITEDPFGNYDRETGESTWGVELICNSISSPGSTPNLDELPHQIWGDGESRGYLILDIKPEAAQSDWFGFLNTLLLFQRAPIEVWQKGFKTLDGENHLLEASSPAAEKKNPPPLAPPEFDPDRVY